MINEVVDRLRVDGYCVLPNPYIVTDVMQEQANNFLQNGSENIRGRANRTSAPMSMPAELLSLVYNDQIMKVFKTIVPGIRCQDMFITYEHKDEGKGRANWLHFDRLRTLKVLVYLSEVKEGCGAFSLLPKSHHKGRELRRGFQSLSNYDEKHNRIELDYPDLYEEPIPIHGPPGTVIFFDSDIFHEGGNVTTQGQRKVIRSHWYPSQEWRILS
jgi:ectoine hydroxylase-related dioxygenase (phytanoyl-CoA dioxygenase family)